LVARLGATSLRFFRGDERARECGHAGREDANALALPFSINGHEVNISVSIGISAYAPDSAGADGMLVQADLALYRSKDEGRNQYHFHSDDLDREVLDRFTLAGEIKRAIEKNEFELQYQPQVELSTQNIVGMEAFIRWNHPTRGQLAPDSSFPLPRRTGALSRSGAGCLIKRAGR